MGLSGLGSRALLRSFVRKEAIGRRRNRDLVDRRLGDTLAPNQTHFDPRERGSFLRHYPDGHQNPPRQGLVDSGASVSDGGVGRLHHRVAHLRRSAGAQRTSEYRMSDVLRGTTLSSLRAVPVVAQFAFAHRCLPACHLDPAPTLFAGRNAPL